MDSLSSEIFLFCGYFNGNGIFCIRVYMKKVIASAVHFIISRHDDPGSMGYTLSSPGYPDAEAGILPSDLLITCFAYAAI